MADKERVTEFRFDLSSPIKYAHAGQDCETEFVVLKEPTSQWRKDILQLKEWFFQAMHSMQDSVNVDEDTKEKLREARKEKRSADADDDSFGSGDEVMAMIAMSPTVKLVDVVEMGRKVFCNGFAVVGGEEPLKPNVADRIAWDDLEAMVGAYYENFILRSSSTRVRSS